MGSSPKGFKGKRMGQLFQDLSALEWEWAKSLQGHKKIAWSFRRNLPETLSHTSLQKVRG